MTGYADARSEQLEAQGLTAAIPEASAAFIADWLMEAGPVVYTEQGQRGLNWVDIAAWSELTGIPLQPWQARLLKRLSLEYLNEAAAAKDPQRPAPFIDEATVAANGAAVSSAFGEALAFLERNTAGKE